MKSIAFIDGSNFYSAARSIERDVDFKKLKKACKPVPMRCMYYATVRPNIEHDAIRPLLDWMAYNGFQIVEKPLKEFEDNTTGKVKYKGNLTVDIAVDLLETTANVDHVTIFSGDGDLLKAVQAIQRRGVEVTVVSTKEMCADELRRQADHFVDLNDMDIFKNAA